MVGEGKGGGGKAMGEGSMAVSQRISAVPGSLRAPSYDPFIGDKTHLEEMRSNFGKGNLVRARSRYVLSHFGDGAVAEVARRMAGPVREAFLNPPLVSDWVPFSLMMEMDKHILEGPMGGSYEHMRKLGEDIALFDMPTIYSAFLKRLSTPAFLMNRVHILYRLYIRDGIAEGKSESPGRATVTIWNRVLPYYFCNWSMTGWLAGAIGLYQAQNIHVDHTVCRHKGASICQWDIRWE
jgi:hypothetical protein